MPKRIQRRRTKGWRMPAGAMYVGRPSVWGNPYSVGDLHPTHGWPMSRQDVVELYRQRIRYENQGVGPDVTNIIRRELAGRDLACWCPLDQPCHADVLLEVANA